MSNIKKGIKLFPEIKLDMLSESDLFKNAKIICHQIQDNVPEKEQVVNIDCNINDGISSYRDFQMTVTVELLRKVIEYCLTKKGIGKDERHKLYVDMISFFFIPMQKVDRIQNSILFYICSNEEARKKILHNPNGAYNIHVNANIQEHSCFVSFEGADLPDNNSENKFEFVPFIELGDSNINCSPGSIIDLLFITDGFFFREIVHFLMAKKQSKSKFNIKQLEGFLFMEVPSEPLIRIIKILENCKFYNLIDFQQLIDGSGQHYFEISLLNFDYYNGI